MNANWPKLEHSKESVKKAAKELVKNNLNSEQKKKNLAIVANFRSAHDYPMQSMNGYFQDRAHEVDKSAIVAGRLKRVPSIIAKLKREQTMQVITMGDIGGIRIIAADLEKTKKIRDGILGGETDHEQSSTDDYLKSPQHTGYRSIHSIYKYRGSKEEYKNFRIELQIRSKIQHAWATTVEVMSLFLNQNLKAGEGEKEWREFFQIVSFAFKDLEEGRQISNSHKEKIKAKYAKLNAIRKLKSRSIGTQLAENRNGYYLLTSDIPKKTIRAEYYQETHSENACKDYLNNELRFTEKFAKDVVLVSAQSLNDLKIAYPNYFSNTEYFVQQLDVVLR